jgi:hypothetical protein
MKPKEVLITREEVMLSVYTVASYGFAGVIHYSDSEWYFSVHAGNEAHGMWKLAVSKATCKKLGRP